MLLSHELDYSDVPRGAVQEDPLPPSKLADRPSQISSDFPLVTDRFIRIARRSIRPRPSILRPRDSVIAFAAIRQSLPGNLDCTQ